MVEKNHKIYVLGCTNPATACGIVDTVVLHVFAKTTTLTKRGDMHVLIASNPRKMTSIDDQESGEPFHSVSSSQVDHSEQLLIPLLGAVWNSLSVSLSFSSATTASPGLSPALNTFPQLMLDSA
jgi:hypothetical protein